MAETEYTRRDIESVAEKEWGRIDIVEAGGGGSGDFSTCNVTVQLTGTYDSIALNIPYIYEDSTDFTGLSSQYVVNNGEPQSVEVVLYKNCAFAYPVAGNSSISTTGSITYDDEEDAIIIQGDGTITISHN